MKDRIKEVRLSLTNDKGKKLTQEDFAKSLGLAKQTITAFETGNRVPAESVLKLISEKYGINYSWLLTGEGEMKSESKEEELARLTAQMFREEDESFRLKLVRMVANMSDEQIEMCQKMVDSLK